jgi:hypothetical protein
MSIGWACMIAFAAAFALALWVLKAPKVPAATATEPPRCGRCGCWRVYKFCASCGAPEYLAKLNWRILSPSERAAAEQLLARGVEFDPSTVQISASGRIQPVGTTRSLPPTDFKPIPTPAPPPDRHGQIRLGCNQAHILPDPPPNVLIRGRQVVRPYGVNTKPKGERPEPPPAPPAPPLNWIRR